MGGGASGPGAPPAIGDEVEIDHPRGVARRGPGEPCSTSCRAASSARDRAGLDRRTRSRTRLTRGRTGAFRTSATGHHPDAAAFSSARPLPASREDCRSCPRQFAAEGDQDRRARGGGVSGSGHRRPLSCFEGPSPHYGVGAGRVGRYICGPVFPGRCFPRHGSGPWFPPMVPGAERFILQTHIARTDP